VEAFFVTVEAFFVTVEAFFVTVEAFFVTVEAFFVTVEAFLVETAVETWLTVMVEVPSPEQCSMKPEETNQREDSK